MKTSLFLLLAVLGFVAKADPAVSSVTVSQTRPWSAGARIDFEVSGTADATWKMTFTAYDGARVLGVLPETALVGDSYVDSDGAKSVTFDPSTVDFLRREGTIADFRVGASCEAAGNILYKVVDLRYPLGTPWQTVYVTEEDLHVGTKTVGIPGSTGTVTWDMSSRTNHITGIESLVWTGVTNNTRYLISHLALRRVKGGSYRMGKDAFARDVTVGGYWIGVFTFSKSQVACLETPDPLADDTWKVVGQFPCVNKTYGGIRGLSAVWPEDGDRVAADSLIGLLRSRTGIGSFDLPTEAQWEYACRAGTSTTYYDNTDDSSNLSALAWYGGEVGTPQRPGQKLPNAFGLYDMIGNVWEYVRDWYATAATAVDAGRDPAGPVSKDRIYRLVRGGACLSGVGNSSNYSRTGDVKTAPDPVEIGNIYGFRVVQTGW